MTLTFLNNRYRIIQTLGSGGFGETFLAEDTHLPSGRRCVIKQLKPITTNPQVQQLVQERFAREAAVLEELGEYSPQIPRLYAYFSEAAQYYLVQEWIEGDTLNKLVHKQGQISEDKVQEILVNILPVLSYIHSKNIVHRDIKPDNIILRHQDHKPVLIDFGAVKETMGTVVNSQGETRSSIVIGTPGYMPSEQGIGRPVYASDLYALGLVAIFLLTGKTPPQLETNYQTGEIIWQNYTPTINPHLAAVLNKAIKPHAGERFLTAQAMLNALQSGTYDDNNTINLNYVTLPPEENINLTISETIPIIKTETNITNTNSNSNNEVTPNRSSPILGSLITGGVIGIFIIIGLWMTRKPASIIDSDGISNKPSTTPTLTPTINPRITPEQALINYYDTLNQGQYEKAWNLLAPDFRYDPKAHPDGYNSYTAWWTQVKYVQVLDVTLIDSNQTNAFVDSQLRYDLQSGRIINQTLRFYFIWDKSSNNWLIEKVKRV